MNADKRFGMTRIAPSGDQHVAIRRFTPENEAEARTVAALEREGMHVVI